MALKKTANRKTTKLKSKLRAAALRIAGGAAQRTTASAKPAKPAEARRRKNDSALQELRGQVAAIARSQAVVSFTLDGTVLEANERFLTLLGYTVDEVRGQHHSKFVDPAQRASAEYRLFWEKLARGEYDAGQYKRLGKDGKEVWIQASYNPILDLDGKPIKVVKFATDITAQKLQAADFEGQLSAISKAQGVIEFSLDGRVLGANANFLSLLGYTLDEIRGQHHSMFVTPDYKASEAYRLFWEKLGRGEYDAGEYQRLGKGGKEIWIQASYNPILDLDGKPFKVVKYATDITAQKLQAADFEGQLSAISKAQGVIEFSLDGKILGANENFLALLGYALDEVRGQHHAMFVEPAHRASDAYRLFWEKLARGEYDAGQYKRLGKGGKEIWIQASYNPILDLNGKPFKVVKYATDITAQKLQAADSEGQLSAISKAQGVIEFTLDGKILDANPNFLALLGYSLDEIRGQHHSMFVHPDMRASGEYRLFWEKLGRGEYDAGEYQRLGKGGKEIWIQASYNPILDLNGKPFKVVKYATDITAQKRQAVENQRVRVALDSVSSAVMVADADCHIAYMNRSVRDLMVSAESDIRKALPQFDSSKLLGANIDVFHKNPSHQRNLLGSLTSTFRSKVTLGGRSFTWTANPVMSATGERLGAVLEWKDVTQELQVENEIADLVQGAVEGDLTRRVDTEGKQGFMLKLAEGINALTGTTAASLNDFAAFLQALSRGDLTQRITADYKGMFETIKNDANTTAGRIEEIVGRIIESAGTIASASGEISAGSADLSSRTEQQASSLQQTAASMEELAATVRQNSENAQQANQLAGGTREAAEKGGRVATSAIEAMNKIEGSSQKIADIIGVIDEIAFQTNLLALNAAVEAARAGDAGKGFAVVASEVRALAQRSAQSSKEIKALIVESGNQVKEGVGLVRSAGTALDDIVASVKRVADIVAEIAAASTEQAAGLEQVNTAVAQMDEMTQRNAALVEESAAAARSLDEQAGSLSEMMDFFTIAEVAAKRTERRPVAAATERRDPTAASLASRRSATGAPAQRAAAAPARRPARAAAIDESTDWKDF